jgi:hypothetical protein
MIAKSHDITITREENDALGQPVWSLVCSCGVSDRGQSKAGVNAYAAAHLELVAIRESQKGR